MSGVSIVTYADGSYLQHACVLVISLNEVANRDRHYDVYFFYSNCSEAIFLKLTSTFSKLLKKNINVRLIECNFGLGNKLKAKKAYMSASVYDKLLIYEELPVGLSKALFLDADIVLLKDPSQLFDVDLGDSILAAVEDDVYNSFSEQAKRTIELGAGKYYFNSGVMVINLEKWRELEISRRSLEFCLTKGSLTPLHDQDAFNYAVAGNWKKISALWNPRLTNILIDELGVSCEISKYEVYARGLAYLVHFSGPHKPWLYMTHHPMKKAYLKHLRSSAFSEYVFPDYSILNLIKKQYREMRRYMKKVMYGNSGWV